MSQLLIRTNGVVAILKINVGWLAADSDRLTKRVEFNSESDDLFFVDDEIEDVGVDVVVGLFAGSQQLSTCKFLLVVVLDVFVALSEVGVFAKIVDVKFGSLSAALALADIGFLHWNFNDFAETGFINVLIIFVDGSDRSIGFSFGCVDSPELYLLTVIFALSMHN